MHTLGLCIHLCPQEYVRVILRDFWGDAVSWLFPSCWLCLSYGVYVREQINVQLGEGRCSKGHFFPMLIICPNQCCYLLPMLTSMRAVWILSASEKQAVLLRCQNRNTDFTRFPFEYHGAVIIQMVDTNRFQPWNCSGVVPLKIC